MEKTKRNVCHADELGFLKILKSLIRAFPKETSPCTLRLPAGGLSAGRFAQHEPFDRLVVHLLQENIVLKL